jgi:hypothetical protein
MTQFSLNLPIDIPWTLIDVSRDMMDTVFCDKKAPLPWRSSIAVYGFEPRVEDLPEELCGKRLTYLKVSCSITGYQATEDEVQKARVELGSEPEVDVGRVLDLATRYFACYGALVTVAVFPFASGLRPVRDKEPDLDTFPHIVEFEPKTRDFYQIASETGEILSTSTHKVGVDKSFMLAETTEDTWKMDSSTTTPRDGGGSATTSGGVSSRRTETDQLNLSLQAELSRERRERQSTTTQLTQMYNLLSSYHAGTNRATFLLLPRPHILQPTAQRTFVHGLRIIEGIQDFFLVVARDREQPGLSIEVSLETGHFPEDAEILAPQESAEPKTVPVTFTYPTKGGAWGTHETLYEFKDGIEADGFVFDDSKGHGGFEFLKFEYDKGVQEKDVTLSNYKAIHEELGGGGSVVRNRVFAYVEVNKGWAASEGTLTARFQAHLRRPRTTSELPVSDPNMLLVTSRRLCTVMESAERCVRKYRAPEIEWPSGRPDLPDPAIQLVGEFPLSPDVFRTDPKAPAGPQYRRLLGALHGALLSGHTKPQRYPYGEVGFLDSVFFRRGLARLLPEAALTRRLRELPGAVALPEPLADITVKELLEAEPAALAHRRGLPLRDVLALRRGVIGTRQPSA